MPVVEAGAAHPWWRVQPPRSSGCTFFTAIRAGCRRRRGPAAKGSREQDVPRRYGPGNRPSKCIGMTRGDSWCRFTT